MNHQKIAMYLPSLEGGGAERVFVQLANEFVSQGICVDFLLVAARGPYYEELSSSVRCIDFNSSGVLASLQHLIRYLRTERPHVIISGLDHANIVTILACMFSDIPIRCVISVRSVPTAIYREVRSIRRWIILQIMKMMYRFADVIIVNSKYGAEDLVRSFYLAQQKLKVIYNPLDLDNIRRLSKMPAEHPWCVPGSPPIILGVGSLSVLKDFQTLIRAFSIIRSIRDCRLVILGEGPDRERLEFLISQLGLQDDVYLPGFVRNPFPWMLNAKVFVCSSLTEGCPNALMQALACGTPVVSTDCHAGAMEILEKGKWGRLVPSGCPEAMSDAILDSIDVPSPPEVQRRASHFQIKDIAQQYLDVLLPGFSRSCKDN